MIMTDVACLGKSLLAVNNVRPAGVIWKGYLNERCGCNLVEPVQAYLPHKALVRWQYEYFYALFEEFGRALFNVMSEQDTVIWLGDRLIDLKFNGISYYVSV